MPVGERERRLTAMSAFRLPAQSWEPEVDTPIKAKPAADLRIHATFALRRGNLALALQ